MSIHGIVRSAARDIIGERSATDILHLVGAVLLFIALNAGAALQLAHGARFFELFRSVAQ